MASSPATVSLAAPTSMSQNTTPTGRSGDAGGLGATANGTSTASSMEDVSPASAGTTPARRGVLSKKKSRAPPKFFKPYTVPDSPEAMRTIEAVSCSSNTETTTTNGVELTPEKVTVASLGTRETAGAFQPGTATVASSEVSSIREAPQVQETAMTSSQTSEVTVSGQASHTVETAVASSVPDDATQAMTAASDTDTTAASGTNSSMTTTDSNTTHEGSSLGKRDHGSSAEKTEGESAVDRYRCKKSKAEQSTELVHFRNEDVQSGMELSMQDTVLSCLKGHRMARSSHAVLRGSGCWYFEFEILPTHYRVREKVSSGDKTNEANSARITMEQIGQVRVGIATNKADVNCSVGFDGHSWSIRGQNGSKVHQGARIPYGDPLQAGDVVGCVLFVGAPDSNHHNEEQSFECSLTASETPYLRLSNSDTGTVHSHSRTLPVRSYVRFYINGKDQGIAFVNLTDAQKYYAAASCYLGGSVRLNGGPHFTFPPPTYESTIVHAARMEDGSINYQKDIWPQVWTPLSDSNTE
eukprot:gb/GECG01000822.1/.p1 GENE.gb/GECG01000822.1/~~gb/GECG01000822.1/.p1  ORF type:complete len:526 (+),score=63.18 gb/GECG01000822.1/:1-1578(+)